MTWSLLSVARDSTEASCRRFVPKCSRVISGIAFRRFGRGERRSGAFELSGEIKQNLFISSPRSPFFQIHKLMSGVHYSVELFAYNEKGSSDGTRLSIYTLKNPEKQTDFVIPMSPLIEDIKPFLPIILGAAGGVLLIGLLITVVVRSCSGGGGRREDRNGNPVNSSRGASNQLSAGWFSSIIDKLLKSLTHPVLTCPFVPFILFNRPQCPVRRASRRIRI